MKIYIDGSKRAAVSRMFPCWEKAGHIVVDNPRDANVQLSVVKIKNHGLPTVLRLDGIYYDLDSNYKSMNKDISISHATADAIAYQSNFSMTMCQKYLAQKKAKYFDVIHNGVESWEQFSQHEGINIVSCSKWRRHKRLPEIIYLFKQFEYLYPNSKLHIIGPMKKGGVEIKAPNVIYYGQLNELDIKKIYETADIYLHLAKKDPCPSSVVEAISAGIPVVTTDATGGATEMTNISINCFIATGDDISTGPDYIYRDSYNKISSEVVTRLLDHMVKIIQKKLRTVLPESLHIQNTAKKYIQLMEKII